MLLIHRFAITIKDMAIALLVEVNSTSIINKEEDSASYFIETIVVVTMGVVVIVIGTG